LGAGQAGFWCGRRAWRWAEGERNAVSGGHAACGAVAGAACWAGRQGRSARRAGAGAGRGSHTSGGGAA
jgi:hypothetical protein